MRILIQDPSSKAYYSGESWDADPVNAVDFESTADAERFCQERNFPGALIVVKFKDDNDDIRFSAGGRSALLSSIVGNSTVEPIQKI